MDKKTVMRSGGVGLTTLAIGLFASGWPEQVRSHPLWVGVVCLIGVGLFVGSFFVQSAHASNGTRQSIKSGRDNFGDQAGRDVYKGGTHYHLPATPEALVAEVRNKELPLKISFATQNVLYYEGSGAWSAAQDYSGNYGLALIAWVSNPVLPKGQPPVDASSISAHIRFSVEDHWEVEIPRAYWMEHSANVVDIRVGHSAGVLIGMVIHSHWTAFVNPFIASLDQTYVPPVIRPLQTQLRQMPIADMQVTYLFCRAMEERWSRGDS